MPNVELTDFEIQILKLLNDGLAYVSGDRRRYKVFTLDLGDRSFAIEMREVDKDQICFPEREAQHAFVGASLSCACGKERRVIGNNAEGVQ